MGYGKLVDLFPQSTSGKMVADSTNLDIDSTDDEHCIQSELPEDPLIQHKEKVDPFIHCEEEGPTKKEARTARAQFLALCWALFVIGWSDGSRGPLLPRIQKFYDVSWCVLVIIFQPLMNSADRVWNCVLDICVTMHGQ